MSMKKMACAALMGLILTAGCQDLDITNPNAPDRARAITQPGDVESLVYGAWPTFIGRTQESSSSYNAMPVIGDEGTATYANNAALELSSEPRVPFNNNSLSSAHGIARYQWYDWYEGLSNVNEGLIAITSGLDIIDDTGEDKTPQVKAFAKFFQGLALGHLGLLFDQGFVVTEESDLANPEELELKPYSELIAQAVASLDVAAEWSQGGSWTIDNVWEGVTVVPDELAKISHSFAARFIVYGARSVEERNALDWNEVIRHLDAGITSDFINMQSSSGTNSSYHYRMQNGGSFAQRADYYLIGPSDVSGNWQAWMATAIPDRTKFLITTPDRRITGETPESDGKYFDYLSYETFRPERGTYHFSYYQWDRLDGVYRDGPLVIMSVDEMRLLRAEAAFRMGSFQQAADLINVTRVGNGELPPVTASGVPQAADCVPKTRTGQCGDLEYALHYERMIEGAGTDCIHTYVDRRGFGSLTPGTFIHFPIPARELETLGMPLYTFGGVGGDGAAPEWRW